MEYIFEIENLEKSFGANEVLKDINLKNKIKSNQIITKKIYNFKSYKFVA